MPNQYVRLIIICCLLIGATLLVSCTQLSQSHTLRVGVIANHAPWEDRNNDVKGVGISLDLMEAYAKVSHQTLEITWLDRKEAFEALDNKKVDLLFTSTPSTQDLFERYAITDPYAKTFSVMIANKKANIISKSDLNRENVRIGVISGSFEESLARTRFSNAQIEVYASRTDAIAKLNAQTIDVFLDDILSALNSLILNKAQLNLNPAPLSDQYQYFVGVTLPENQKLVDHFNDFLSDSRHSGLYDQITKKYLDPLSAYLNAFSINISL